MSYLAAFGAIILAAFFAIAVIAAVIYFTDPIDETDEEIAVMVVLSMFYLAAIILWLSGTPSPITWD